MLNKIFKIFLFILIIFTNIYVFSSCNKEVDTTIKLIDENNQEYVVKETEDFKDITKIINSLNKKDIIYSDKCEIDLCLDGSIYFNINNININLNGINDINLGFDFKNLDINNNQIDNNYEFYLKLNLSDYIGIINPNSSNIENKSINIPLGIQTINEGEFIFINIGKNFYIDASLLEYLLTDNLDVIANYQEILKNVKINILKDKFSSILNEYELIKYYNNLKNYNKGFGIFESLFDINNLSNYDVKITYAKSNLITFNINENINITYDISLMQITNLSLKDYKSNGIINTLFNIPIELDVSSIDIDIRHNEYNQNEIDISDYKYISI